MKKSLFKNHSATGLRSRSRASGPRPLEGQGRHSCQLGQDSPVTQNLPRSPAAHGSDPHWEHRPGSLHPSRVSPHLGCGRHTGARTGFPTRQPVPSPSQVHRRPARFPNAEAILASGPEARGSLEASSSPKVRPGRERKDGRPGSHARTISWHKV